MRGQFVNIWYWNVLHLNDTGVKCKPFASCIFASVCGRLNQSDSISTWAQLIIQRKTKCLYKPLSASKMLPLPWLLLSFTQTLSLSLQSSFPFWSHIMGCVFSAGAVDVKPITLSSTSSLHLAHLYFTQHTDVTAVSAYLTAIFIPPREAEGSLTTQLKQQDWVEDVGCVGVSVLF